MRAFNSLGRFQNALGTFQEAPERETMMFHWFWEFFWGDIQGRADPGGWISRPPKSRFFKTDQTPLELGKGKGRGKHKGKYRGLGKGKWARTPTHAVAQSAVADTKRT